MNISIIFLILSLFTFNSFGQFKVSADANLRLLTHKPDSRLEFINYNDDYLPYWDFSYKLGYKTKKFEIEFGQIIDYAGLSNFSKYFKASINSLSPSVFNKEEALFTTQEDEYVKLGKRIIQVGQEASSRLNLNIRLFDAIKIRSEGFVLDKVVEATNNNNLSYTNASGEFFSTIETEGLFRYYKTQHSLMYYIKDQIDFDDGYGSEATEVGVGFTFGKQLNVTEVNGNLESLISNIYALRVENGLSSNSQLSGGYNQIIQIGYSNFRRPNGELLELEGKTLYSSKTFSAKNFIFTSNVVDANVALKLGDRSNYKVGLNLNSGVDAYYPVLRWWSSILDLGVTAVGQAAIGLLSMADLGDSAIVQILQTAATVSLYYFANVGYDTVFEAIRGEKPLKANRFSTFGIGINIGIN